MMATAFDYSEKICLPVLMRVTTRMAHSRAVVQCADVPRQQNELNYNAVAANWVLLPANAKKRNVQQILVWTELMFILLMLRQVRSKRLTLFTATRSHHPDICSFLRTEDSSMYVLSRNAA